MFLTVVCFAFFAGYAALLFFYYRHWIRLKEYVPSASSPSIFVSVIVAARNEERTLPFLLEDLSQQRYPSHLFEVIVVNDFSTDNTVTAVEKFAGPQVQMIYPDSSPLSSSKKKALASGIKKAKGELIIITDADCRVGKAWVETIVNFYGEKQACFIAAPVKFVHNNSLLQIFQALDFISLQGITAASVSANFHTMCNGANLAYTKKAFESVNGFEGIDKVPTGDDMLLMHKIWKQAPSKVFYLKSKEAVVATSAMQTWKEFLRQRRRWASKTLVYKDYRIVAVLGAVLLVNLLPFVLVVAGIFHGIYFLHFIFFLLGKTIVEWPFVASVAKFYDEQKLLRYFFLLQPLHVFYTVLVGIWSQFGSYEWKGRMAPTQGAVG